jgi:hypothetical protein
MEVGNLYRKTITGQKTVSEIRVRKRNQKTALENGVMKEHWKIGVRKWSWKKGLKWCWKMLLGNGVGKQH